MGSGREPFNQSWERWAREFDGHLAQQSPPYARAPKNKSAPRRQMWEMRFPGTHRNPLPLNCGYIGGFLLGAPGNTSDQCGLSFPIRVLGT